MGERSEIPSVFARVHPKFRTPYVAIIANSVVALGLSLSGSFTDLAASAAITRLAIYALCCAAVLVLRNRWGPSEGFRVPAAPVVVVTGILLCAWLLSTRSLAQSWFLLVIIAAGAAAWLASRGNRRADRPAIQ